MGQYYNPIILEKDNDTVKSYMYSHEYGSGLKLMEHSWMENEFVGAFESQLIENPQRVVWAGDYADKEPNGNNLYCLCDKELKVCPAPIVVSAKEYPYLVNWTKGLYIDKRKVKDIEGWSIHPLPLMTCEGNGRGGGDYRYNDVVEEDLVGSWSRDLISVEKKVEKDFTEVEFSLVENY